MEKHQPIPNSACLVEACRELGIRYRFYDSHHNLVGVILDREYIFANASTPFNGEAFGKICKDKEFMYRIIHDSIRMPKSLGFLDPNCNPEYQRYVAFSTHEKIIGEIEKNFSYPLIMKKNSGSRGVNVFKCGDRRAAGAALAAIYDKASQHYDYIAIVQEYIPIRREFRVIIFQGKITLVYEKEFAHATCTDNISPLHQENSKAVLIRDTGGTDNTRDKILIERMSDFVAPLCERIHIGFAGLDIAIDANDRLYLIEINSKPGFEYFVRDNGTSKLVELYKKMLKSLIK